MVTMVYLLIIGALAFLLSRVEHRLQIPGLELAGQQRKRPFMI